MDDIKRKASATRAQLNDLASDLLNDGVHYVDELYKDGIKKAASAQKEVEVFKDEMLEQVRENPLKAILIAGGVGFLLSCLIRK